MNVAEANVRLPSRAAGRFAPYHEWDRNFFLLWVLLIWLGIIVGFGREIHQQIETHQSAPPLIVFIHAAAFGRAREHRICVQDGDAVPQAPPLRSINLNFGL